MNQAEDPPLRQGDHCKWKRTSTSTPPSCITASALVNTDSKVWSVLGNRFPGEKTEGHEDNTHGLAWGHLASSRQSLSSNPRLQEMAMHRNASKAMQLNEQLRSADEWMSQGWQRREMLMSHQREGYGIEWRGREGSTGKVTCAVTHLLEEGKERGDQPQWKENFDGREKGPGNSSKDSQLWYVARLPSAHTPNQASSGSLSLQMDALTGEWSHLPALQWSQGMTLFSNYLPRGPSSPPQS